MVQSVHGAWNDLNGRALRAHEVVGVHDGHADSLLDHLDDVPAQHVVFNRRPGGSQLRIERHVGGAPQIAVGRRTAVHRGLGHDQAPLHT